MARVRDLLPGLHSGAPMSTIAHLGPAMGRQGGPSGYLAQLARGLDQYGAGTHRVLLPPRTANAAPPAARRPAGRPLTFARRLRLTYLGSPRFDRPQPEELTHAGGPLAHLIDDAWAGVQREATESLAHARAADPDVLFVHDAPSAEIALDSRRPGQEVWLLLHNPMPLALYMAW